MKKTIVIVLYHLIMWSIGITKAKVTQTRELNITSAINLCSGNSGCDFYDNTIWLDGLVPNNGDSILMVTGESLLSINLIKPINLSDVTIDGKSALIVSDVSLVVEKNVNLTGYAQILLQNANLDVKTMKMDYGMLATDNSVLSVVNVWTSNDSTITLSTGSAMTCSLCFIDGITTDPSSSFSAVDVALWSRDNSFGGKVDIDTLVVGSQADFYGPTMLRNVSILKNANIGGNNIQIWVLFMSENSDLFTNGTAVLLPHGDSIIYGEGSLAFYGSFDVTFGNNDIVTNLSGFSVQLFGANVLSFINVIFGLTTSDNKGEVLLNIVSGTFTQILTGVYASITASGLTILETFELLGEISCNGGSTVLDGAVSCTNFYQKGGDLLLGSISTSGFVSLTSVAVSVRASISYITGNVTFTDSPVRLTGPLYIKGSLQMYNCTIDIPSLNSVFVFLNVSGDLILYGQLQYSLPTAPTSTTVYPLLAYTGNLMGNFSTVFVSSAGADYSYFSVEYREKEVVLVYTDPSPPPSHHSPFTGYKIALTVAGGVLFLIILIGSIIVITRKKRRQYDVIPSSYNNIK